MSVGAKDDHEFEKEHGKLLPKQCSFAKAVREFAFMTMTGFMETIQMALEYIS
jgi:hypothetical protein